MLPPWNARGPTTTSSATFATLTVSTQTPGANCTTTLLEGGKFGPLKQATCTFYESYTTITEYVDCGGCALETLGLGPGPVRNFICSIPFLFEFAPRRSRPFISAIWRCSGAGKVSTARDARFILREIICAERCGLNAGCEMRHQHQGAPGHGNGHDVQQQRRHGPHGSRNADRNGDLRGTLNRARPTVGSPWSATRGGRALPRGSRAGAETQGQTYRSA